MVYLKTLLFLVLIPGTVVVYLPLWILSSRSDVASVKFEDLGFSGLLFTIPGVAILLWCVWDFAHWGKGTPAPIDPPKELVVKGLYRYVRNPMYIGVLMTLWGESLLFRSMTVLAYSFALFLLFHSFVYFYEERVLRQKFGDSYDRYRDEVPRWVPRLKR